MNNVDLLFSSAESHYCNTLVVAEYFELKVSLLFIFILNRRKFSIFLTNDIFQTTFIF